MLCLGHNPDSSNGVPYAHYYTWDPNKFLSLRLPKVSMTHGLTG